MSLIETASHYNTRNGVASGVWEKGWSYRELPRLARYPGLSVCNLDYEDLIVNGASLPKIHLAEACFRETW